MLDSLFSGEVQEKRGTRRGGGVGFVGKSLTIEFDP